MKNLIRTIQDYRSAEQKLYKQGLTPAEVLILEKLVEMYKTNKEVYISDILKSCELKPTVLSNIVKKMEEEKGYIKRQRQFNGNDKRKMLIYLTSQGRYALSKLEKSWKDENVQEK